MYTIQINTKLYKWFNASLASRWCHQEPDVLVPFSRDIPGGGLGHPNKHKTTAWPLCYTASCELPRNCFQGPYWIKYTSITFKNTGTYNMCFAGCFWWTQHKVHSLFPIPSFLVYLVNPNLLETWTFWRPANLALARRKASTANWIFSSSEQTGRRREDHELGDDIEKSAKRIKVM